MRGVTFLTPGALFGMNLTGYGRPMRFTTTGTVITISHGDIHIIVQRVDGGSDADLKSAFTALGVELANTSFVGPAEVGVDRWTYDEDGTHRVWWLDLSDRGERPW